jgi:hypothetical protein
LLRVRFILVIQIVFVLIFVILITVARFGGLAMGRIIAGLIIICICFPPAWVLFKGIMGDKTADTVKRHPVIVFLVLSALTGFFMGLIWAIGLLLHNR